VAGGEIPPEPTFLLFGREVPATVVGTADAFPGMSSRYPLMVASATRLEESLEGRLVDFQPVFQVWSDGPPEPVLEALGEAEVFPSGTTTIEAIQETPRFLALSWIFGFLQALGILVGLIALAAVLLYVQSRQRAREVAYVLARSMGLSPGAHRRSVTMELGAMLGCAFAIGALLATLAAAVIHRKVDFLPGLPPSTVLAVPVLPFALILGAVVVVAWVAAWAVQRTADRSNTSEVMRLAG
jgi:putative ABC transport system permease protein